MIFKPEQTKAPPPAKKQKKSLVGAKKKKQAQQEDEAAKIEKADEPKKETEVEEVAVPAAPAEEEVEKAEEPVAEGEAEKPGLGEIVETIASTLDSLDEETKKGHQIGEEEEAEDKVEEGGEEETEPMRKRAEIDPEVEYMFPYQKNGIDYLPCVINCCIGHCRSRSLSAPCWRSAPPICASAPSSAWPPPASTTETP